jgi:carbamoyl-phosphate synthase large subunit
MTEKPDSGRSFPVQVPFTVLLSSIGRRVQLVECFREAFRDLNLSGRVIGIDVAPEHAPAAHVVDRCFRVPRCTDAEFIPTVLRICQEEHVRLLVPTIDTELPAYAQHRSDFCAAGTKAIVSDPRTVLIARDKIETHRWLVEHGFPTVRQDSIAGVLSDPGHWQFPLIAKPFNGSSSLGVVKVDSLMMLQALADIAPNLIVQEHAKGLEHTVNVLVEDGRCICAVPHCRLETRGGEVSKGITRKHEYVMEVARAIAEELPGAYGPLNIQCFLADDGNIQVTEINARFGGGFPLANYAGAKFPRWLIEPLVGTASTASFASWDDNLLMLRHDSAVFVSSH